jgi:hypothetical protein
MITGLPTKQFIAKIDKMLRQGGERFHKRDYVCQRHQFKLDAEHVVVMDVFRSKARPMPMAWVNSYMLCLSHRCTEGLDSAVMKAAGRWGREIRKPLLEDAKNADLVINVCEMGEWLSVVPEKFGGDPVIEGGQI